MRFSFLVRSRARLKRIPSGVRKSLPSHSSSSHALPDILRTSLVALRESADACPPLKSAMGAAVALWDIAEGAKNAKSEAHDIALPTNEIMDNICDAVPDIYSISPLLLRKIEELALILGDIQRDMETITSSGSIARFTRLNHNKRLMQGIRAKLEEKTRDFAVLAEIGDDQIEARQCIIEGTLSGC